MTTDNQGTLEEYRASVHAVLSPLDDVVPDAQMQGLLHGPFVHRQWQIGGSVEHTVLMLLLTLGRRRDSYLPHIPPARR